MTKLERLSWIERTFGTDCISPYLACRNLVSMINAIDGFQRGGRGVGIRTDLVDGHTQGYQLPFVWKAGFDDAHKLWEKHRDRLVYIVCENVLRVRLNAVAQKLDAEHVFFEFNDREHETTQRDMYKQPDNVRRIALGPNRFVLPWGNLFVRCVDPVDASFYRFDQIYDILIHSDQDEATFSVREDGRLVVW